MSNILRHIVVNRASNTIDYEFGLHENIDVKERSYITIKEIDNDPKDPHINEYRMYTNNLDKISIGMLTCKCPIWVVHFINDLACDWCFNLSHIQCGCNAFIFFFPLIH